MQGLSTFAPTRRRTAPRCVAVPPEHWSPAELALMGAEGSLGADVPRLAHPRHPN